VAQESETRFWVRYDLEGNAAVLYKLSFTGYFFQRWDTDKWVDASDRYLRITRDAACDEISAERAQQVLNDFAKHQLSKESFKFTDNGSQESFKNDNTNPAAPLHTSTHLITDGFSALATSAIALHEMFLGLLSAGFTEDQALKIITGIVRSD
jgi:hypothetical protein